MPNFWRHIWGHQMPQKIDNAAIITTATAPAWAGIVSGVNTVLTTVSLVLGIAFLLWRWHKSAKNLKVDD